MKDYFVSLSIKMLTNIILIYTVKINFIFNISKKLGFNITFLHYNLFINVLKINEKLIKIN